MKNDTLLIVGGLAVGGFLLYESDFFGKLGTGLEDIGAGLGSGFSSIGGGVYQAGSGFGQGLTYAGESLYQVGTGAGNMLNKSSLSDVFSSIFHGTTTSNTSNTQTSTNLIDQITNSIKSLFNFNSVSTTQQQNSTQPNITPSPNPSPQPTPQSTGSSVKVSPSQQNNSLLNGNAGLVFPSLISDSTISQLVIPNPITISNTSPSQTAYNALVPVSTVNQSQSFISNSSTSNSAGNSARYAILAAQNSTVTLKKPNS